MVDTSTNKSSLLICTIHYYLKKVFVILINKILILNNAFEFVVKYFFSGLINFLVGKYGILWSGTASTLLMLSQLPMITVTYFILRILLKYFMTKLRYKSKCRSSDWFFCFHKKLEPCQSGHYIIKNQCITALVYWWFFYWYCTYKYDSLQKIKFLVL